ncbi:MAG: alcohol dehydrogenase catalytic domain-containing protein [Bifidobacteriaceae bacterium]|jgi:L-idonate 5-dehydrogenase|nr:alcohol dehydrogenase catalytic domain-containing protein [Bifidobacteriaceae bacterium]
MKAVMIFAKNDLRLVEKSIGQLQTNQVVLAVEWGGICGSDMSYFSHGRSGTVEVKQPLIVGHEFAGKILQIGKGVKDLQIGDAVTVFPAKKISGVDLPSRLLGKDNLLAKVEYYGSAALPTDGGFVEEKIVEAWQAKKLPSGVSTKIGSLAEPLSVAAHAVAQAGEINLNQPILVNGSGPIGLLILAWLKFKGAKQVILSDMSDLALATAKKVGADKTINVKTVSLPQDVETVFEATGAMVALDGVLKATARGGTLVQVGNLPIVPQRTVIGQLVTREIKWQGSFRFTEAEFEEVVNSLDKIDGLEAVISHEFSISQYKEAFVTATDKSMGAAKVLININN